MIKENGKYYLYRHVRLDKNEPFYIGVGTKNKRSFIKYSGEYNRAFSKNRNSIWKRIVNKTEYIIEILMESDSYNFIEDKEKEFIKLYGRIDKNNGVLCNLNDGGKSFTGGVVSEDYKKKLSKRRKGCPMSEEQKKKLSEINKGKKLSEETIRRITEASTGRKIPREAIERGRIKRIGSKRTEETKRRLREAWEFRKVKYSNIKHYAKNKNT